MKKIINSAIAAVMCLCLVFSLVACGESTEENADLWSEAIYTESQELGNGEKKVEIEVKAEEKSITFTIHTDSDTVGDALIENGLLTGEPGNPGLYVKSVNGITADYDVNQSYWAFYINGEYAVTGVDTTEITDGTAYRLEYTK